MDIPKTEPTLEQRIIGAPCKGMDTLFDTHKRVVLEREVMHAAVVADENDILPVYPTGREWPDR